MLGLVVKPSMPLEEGLMTPGLMSGRNPYGVLCIFLGGQVPYPPVAVATIPAAMVPGHLPLQMLSLYLKN